MARTVTYRKGTWEEYRLAVAQPPFAVKRVRVMPEA
jgi:hypothetical protein